MSGKISPSRLKYIKGLLVDGAELSAGERDSLINLIDERAGERRLGNALSEFHRWVCQGDQILNEVEKELTELRALTRKDGDTISKSAVLDILGKLYMKTPKDERNFGANWALDKVAEEIENLYTI